MSFREHGTTDSQFVEWLRIQLPGLVRPPRWLRKDWAENFVDHAPTDVDFTKNAMRRSARVEGRAH